MSGGWSKRGPLPERVYEAPTGIGDVVHRVHALQEAVGRAVEGASRGPGLVGGFDPQWIEALNEHPIDRIPFIQLLDAFLEKVRNGGREHSGSWAPSSIYYCPRQAWYRRSGYPAVSRKYADSYRILELGTWIHTMLEVWFTLMFGPFGASEVPIEGGKPRAKLFMDYVVSSRQGRILLEFKGVKTEKFNSAPLKSYAGAEPKTDHKWQAHACMRWSRQLWACPIEVAYVIYLDKNTSKMKALLYEWDDDIEREMVERIKLVEHHVRRGKPAPAEPPPFGCTECDFLHHCAVGQKSEGAAYTRRGS